MKLREATVVPPGGFWYQQPETGLKYDAGTLEGTTSYFLEHRIANDLDRATREEIRQDIETQICQRVPSNFCNDCNHPDWTFSLETIVGVGKTIATLVSDKFKGQLSFVTQEEAETRADRCSKCFRNSSTSGCGPGCKMRGKLAEMFGYTIGDRKTEKDEKLQYCSICGCACRVIAHYKLDILKDSVNEEKQKAFEDTPLCWRK
jgi:hypothetical protein